MYRRVVFAALAVAVSFACCLTLTDFIPSARAQGSDLPTLGLGSPIGGLNRPVGITNAGDGSNRIFVVDQFGLIRIVKNGAPVPTPFLDISTRISAGDERGLLGLAFAPDYARRGYFYVNYTNPAGNTVISRFRRSASNADLADPSSEQVVITIAQPFPNHNGGQLAFGRDGYLYVGMGDGGGGGDPGNRAQNTLELLGKILRIDVETGRPYTYTSPASNPFFNRAGFRPEIWALGVRNPWRFSFDRLTGSLYVADVGQGEWEEVNFQPASSPGGENYGWRITEGTHCFNPNPCSTAGLTLPVVEYDHSAGNCSVTGGYVYRGSEFPRMQGLYFYGDFCSGRIWALKTSDTALLLDNAFQISAFGEDEAGNVYVAAYNTGQIFKLVDNGPSLPPTGPIVSQITFGGPSFITSEGTGFISIPVSRTGGDLSRDLTVDYVTLDDTASERTDYTTARGTLRFKPGETSKSFNVLITDDRIVEGGERFLVRLSNVRGASNVILESEPVRPVFISDNDQTAPPGNPIDETDYFVRQHYRDFLNREPDATGLAFWTNNIESCGANAQCREVKRIDTSAAFFLAIEFQETGFFAYRVHKTAFGNLPGRPVPITFNDFIRDSQEIGADVVVNQGDWQGLLDRNKQSYVDAFVSRDEFVAAYPTAQTPAQYVSALNTNAGFAITAGEEADLAARLAAGQETRATVLRKIADDADLRSAETNRAFVLMEYFGYLRRNPNDPPQLGLDFSGYNFWLTKLNDNGGDYRRAEMVRAFISSDEYRNRFK